jgi:serine/threonine-protein kinase RsbW
MAFCIPFVVEEIFTNMVKYNRGSPNRIRIGIGRTGDAVAVRLTDFDVDPFDPADAPEVDVDLPLEARRRGGLGLHLVKSLADKLTYEYENRVMKISVLKRIKADVRDPAV